MTRRFAQTPGHGDRIPRSVALPPEQPAPALDTRLRIAQALGTKVAAQLGWNTHYTAAELAALGEQLILDHAMHGDDAAGTRMIVALSQAASTAQAPSPDLHDHDKQADRIFEFLTSEFKAELTVADAARRLAALRMPRRPDLARELLQSIGLDPDRRVDTPQLVDPDNPLATNEAKKAADYYFNYDALSAGDIRNMSDRPLPDAEVAAKRAALPASLDAEFSRRFDAYTRTAAEETIKLVDGWLSWIARKLGVNLDDARVELSTVRLQYYRRRMKLVRGELSGYDSATLREMSSAGYIATIHTAGHEYRYFLSTADGGAFPMATDTPVADWALQHANTVFGVPPDAAGQDRTSPRRLRTRVVSDPLAQGKRAGLSTWLGPTLRSRSDQARSAARGQTPGEQAIDTLLDFIPFRRMIVAIRQGDLATALIAGSIDVMTFAIPMLCSGLRLAAGASRALLPLVRQAGRAMAAAAVEQPARTAMIELPELRSSIKAGLEALNGTSSTAGDLRPIDAEAMASALRHRHPRLAEALDQAALQVRGTDLRDGWWQVSRSASAQSADAEITGLQQVSARSADDQALSLLPYGDDSGRAYTEVDPATHERRGAILLADSRAGFTSHYPSTPWDAIASARRTSCASSAPAGPAPMARCSWAASVTRASRTTMWKSHANTRPPRRARHGASSGRPRRGATSSPTG